MTRPEKSLRNALKHLRQYPLGLANNLPSIREHLLELANKVARKLADDRDAKRENHLRIAKEGLKAYVPTEATPAMGTFVSLKSHENVPGAADERLICDLMRWWMERDPLGASRGVVDAVGLGGAHRLSAEDRLKLARAFLAMLDIDPLAAQWSTLPAGPQEGFTQSGDGGTAPLAAAVNKKSAARAGDASPRVRRPPVC